MAVEVSDFTIRSRIEPFGSSFLDPAVLRQIVAQTVDSAKGLGLAFNQLRIETNAPVLIERGIEAFFPDTQILARITPQQIELQCGRAGRAARVTAAVFFDQLVKNLNPLLGTTNAAVTLWAVHVKGAIRPPSPPAPPLGSHTSTGFVFNYGTAPWDPSIMATSYVVEPSAHLPDGTFLSITNIWAKDEEPLVKRLDELWRQWQRLTGVELTGPLA